MKASGLVHSFLIYQSDRRWQKKRFFHWFVQLQHHYQPTMMWWNSLTLHPSFTIRSEHQAASTACPDESAGDASVPQCPGTDIQVRGRRPSFWFFVEVTPRVISSHQSNTAKRTKTDFRAAERITGCHWLVLNGCPWLRVNRFQPCPPDPRTACSSELWYKKMNYIFIYFCHQKSLQCSHVKHFYIPSYIRKY